MNRFLMLLFRVRVLRVQRGDVLVVFASMPRGEAKAIHEYLSKHFGFLLPVVVAAPESRIEVLRSPEPA